MGDVKPHHSLGVEKKFADNGPGSGSDENARMRLLHAVQRERGVTCGWVASSGAQPWNDLHVELRRATDERDAASDVRQKLVEMRAAADASVGGAPRRKLAEVALGTQPTVAADFYTAFTSYNALCEQILTRPAAQALRDADGEAVEAEPWRRQGKDNALGAGWAVPMLAFARLKNWHGVERAFLCGVLALPDDAVASLPSRAFADLVIGLQQQRNQEAIVREAVPPKPVLPSREPDCDLEKAEGIASEKSPGAASLTGAKRAAALTMAPRFPPFPLVKEDHAASSAARPARCARA